MTKRVKPDRVSPGRAPSKRIRTIPKGWKPPPPTEDTSLNSMQQAFVRGVAEGLNHTAAAHMAGYKHPAVQGHQLLQRPHIKKALVLAREEYVKASQMTKKKVMDGFLDAIAQARTISDPSAQIQGWNSIAKMCGYFEPTKHKIEVDVKGKIVIERLQALSDDELIKLAEGDGDIIDAEYTEAKDPPLLENHTGTHDEGKLV